MVVVIVEARAEKPESVVGVNVSVRIDEPIVAVRMDPPRGSGTFEDCELGEAPGGSDGG